MCVGAENRPLESADTTEADASDVLPAKRRRVDSVPVSRVSMLLSREQMAKHGYPLPGSVSGNIQFGKASSLDIAPLTILNSGTLQPRKWQLTGNDCSIPRRTQ